MHCWLNKHGDSCMIPNCY
ncbi:hypothetical protein LINPERHAP2_LOCUS836 [Linum perenne]